MQRFRVTIAVAVTILLVSCGSQPPATPGQSVAGLVGTPEPPAIASAGPTIPVELPAELRDVAWSRLTRATDADGALDHVVLEAGLLGHLATFTASIPREQGTVSTAIGGRYVAIIRSQPDAGRGRIDVLDARTDMTLGSFPFDGRPGADPVFVDPEARVLYTSSVSPRGGIEIFRVGLDGSDRTSLVRLDKRFAPDGIPQDRYGLALTASGTLVAIACGRADGCRVWEIPQGARAAPPPIRLAANVPVICDVAAASDDVLIVYDPGACSDEGGVPLPVRAIDLGDGSTRLIAAEPRILVRRVVEVAGASKAIASVAAGPGTYTIDAIDVETGQRSVLVGPLAEAGDAVRPIAIVSPANLPGAWVLVAPPSPSPSDAASQVPAVLVDVSTGAAIQLPVGTYGWEEPVGG